MSAFPIPVSVLTGFLGVGKTTLLNRLLKEPAFADTAVIINEFGDIAIDHLLVEQSSDGIIQLSDGCLCCTVRGELVDTLADLVARLRDARIARLSRVVIETTGLADPVPVLQSIMGHPLLAQAFRLDGVITLVDAVNGAATLNTYVEAVRQAAMADRIVITKTDIVEAGDTTALKIRLGQINPNAAILDSAAALNGAASLLHCGLYDPATKTADVRRWLGEAAVDTGQEHHRRVGHDHGDHSHNHGDHRHHHDDRIRSVTLTNGAPLPLSALETFLDLIGSAHGDRLLRLKGIIETVEDPAHPLVVHGVQRLMHPPAWLPAWPDAGRGTRLVLITQDMPEDYIRRLFAAVTNRPAVDTPDRAALKDNPLAVAGFKG